MREELSEERARAERFEVRASEYSQELHRAQQELSEARDDLRLALRVQRVAQADLSDLQNRYDELFAEKEELDELLERVAGHLASTVQDADVVLDSGPASAKPASKGAKVKKARSTAKVSRKK